MSARALTIWFLLVIGFGLSSRWSVSRGDPGACSLDGTPITEIYRVDLLVDGIVRESFCCVRCASEWPDTPADSTWHVRDEITGAVIDARVASFVISSVVTQPTRQDRCHVFANSAAATAHASEYGGELIPNPLNHAPRDLPRAPAAQTHDSDDENP